MKPIVVGLVLLVSVTSTFGQTIKPSECAARLLTQFSTSVVDLKHGAERAATDTDTLEMFVSTPLRFQRTMEEDSAAFRLSFRECPKSIVEAADQVAVAFETIAKGYALAVQAGKTVWLMVNQAKNASNEAELTRITEQIEELRLTMVEQNVDMERRHALLPQVALLVFGGVVGKDSTKDQVALLLSEMEKQKIVHNITKLCAGQCVLKAGVEYPYAAVGLLLENLQKPFLLNGVPIEN